jgi:hypothetical protein
MSTIKRFGHYRVENIVTAKGGFDLAMKFSQLPVLPALAAAAVLNGSCVNADTNSATTNALIWNYDAREGTEVHTIQPIGTGSFVMV